MHWWRLPEHLRRGLLRLYGVSGVGVKEGWKLILAICAIAFITVPGMTETFEQWDEKRKIERIRAR